ncbi:hypothetical protein NADFUDRAFT_41566 [Nadsonia fulvescens var. elongata DSM 6958]|uniref:Uncharacterized protein n=1 Tax=Nadsonia fulvescens var. elongata DSM 6958 TaxID=857566 RepID=A0A1E3PL53_9ASCO|nr:hypothetical protein NADFUDRAFT_41566 [Nadsonia fulvescens var. elongata DSM 6958]
MSKGKTRKGQTVEEFEVQKALYAKGPVIQTSESLLERDFSAIYTKLDRMTLKAAAERAYYIGDYQRSLDLLNTKEARTKFGGKEAAELEYIRLAAQDKLSTSKSN